MSIGGRLEAADGEGSRDRFHRPAGVREQSVRAPVVTPYGRGTITLTE
jgi:hypothetical protein